MVYISSFSRVIHSLLTAVEKLSVKYIYFVLIISKNIILSNVIFINIFKSISRLTNLPIHQLAVFAIKLVVIYRNS